LKGWLVSWDLLDFRSFPHLSSIEPQRLSGANPTTLEFTTTTPALWPARVFFKVE
jgi:hypothetical protein